MFYRCFFLLFPFATKIPDNRSRERPNGFSWNFYQTIAGKMEFASPYPNGDKAPINFLGAKNYTLRTWWWRLASDWELVCWLWHCAATAVALKRHERVNAFNLVLVEIRVIRSRACRQTVAAAAARSWTGESGSGWRRKRHSKNTTRCRRGTSGTRSYKRVMRPWHCAVRMTPSFSCCRRRAGLSLIYATALIFPPPRGTTSDFAYRPPLNRWVTRRPTQLSPLCGTVKWTYFLMWSVDGIFDEPGELSQWFLLRW